MKRQIFPRMYSIPLVSLISLFLFCLALPGQVSAKTYRWKIQSAYPRGDVSMELLKDFAATVEKKSNGQLKISVFGDPEIVPAEQLFESTKKGVLDMLHGLGAMWAGIVPVGEVEFGLPYAYRMPDQKSFRDGAHKIRKFFYESGFVKLVRKEYSKQGLYWLDMHTYGPAFILSTKSIESCNQLKGVKMTLEGSFNDFYNILGAQGSIVSGTETYIALKLGTLDAAQWDVSAITALKWHEVAPYWIRGGSNQQNIGHIMVNMKSWNALDDNLKNILRDAASNYFESLVKVYIGELAKVTDLVEAGKVKESWLDDDCQKKHSEAAVKIWNQIALRDPANAKAIELIKQWTKLK